ncbi:MAG: ATP-binding protein [Suipraeoptans sp.]
MLGIWDKVSYSVQLIAVCILFMIPLRKKDHYIIRITFGSIAFIVFSYLLNSSFSPGSINILFFLYWGYYIGACLLLTRLVIEGTWLQAIFCTVCMCAIQHVAFDVYLIVNLVIGDVYIVLALAFIIVYLLFYFLFIKKLPRDLNISGGIDNIIPMASIIVLTWILSTLSETGIPMFEAATGQKILFRVIDAICCIYILWVQRITEKRMNLQREIEGINHAWRTQASQYKITKTTIDSIDRKCHDLKHQIQALRYMSSESEKQEFFDEIEKDVMIFGSAQNTGNQALDIVLMEKGLYCSNNGIQWSCMADGSKLNFIKTEDIYAIFGNALDNAIEEALSLHDIKKRIITVKVITQKNIVVIQVQNYFQGEINFENGLPLTTKRNKRNHGFGIKSIQYVSEKYNGTTTVYTQGDIFSLQILIPIETDV